MHHIECLALCAKSGFQRKSPLFRSAQAVHTIIHIKQPEQPRDVGFHRILADVQRVCDLLVAEAAIHQAEDLYLAPGQGSNAGPPVLIIRHDRWRLVIQRQVRQQTRGNMQVTLPALLYGINNLVYTVSLRKVANHAQLKKLPDHRRILNRRHDHQRCFVLVLVEVTHKLQPTHSRHHQIQDIEIVRVWLQQRLRYQLSIRLEIQVVIAAYASQRCNQALAEGNVVINQQDVHGAKTTASTSKFNLSAVSHTLAMILNSIVVLAVREGPLRYRCFIPLLLGLWLSPVTAVEIPAFEELLPLGRHAHLAPLGDGSPDLVEWSTRAYLSDLDQKIEAAGFNESTGLDWSTNQKDTVAMSPDAQETLVAFELSVKQSSQFLLEVSAPEGVAWYFEDHNGVIHHHVDNYRQALAGRTVFDIRPVIPLQLEPGHNYRLLIVSFVFTPGSTLSFNLWHPEAFRAQRTAFYFTEGIFFGFTATIAAASLVLAVAFRQLLLFFFAGFVASYGLSVYTISGFSLLFGIGSRVDLSIPLIAATFGATTMFVNLFSMVFLDMWNTHRKLFWTYAGLVLYVLIVTLVIAVAGDSIAEIRTIFVMTMIGGIVGQIAHFYALVHYFKRNPHVVYWWVGITAFSISLIVSTISAAEPLEVELAGRLIAQMTIVLEAVLLIILLIYYFRGEQSSRRAAQHAAMENLRLARDIEQSRSSFVAAVGHDLRAPVQAISHFAESLQQAASDSSRQVLRKIEANVKTISELLDSMISLSRADWQASQPTLEPVAVRPILLGLRSEFLGKAARKSIELTVETAECAVLSDRVCLTQILRNLIDNAIKYTEKGFVRVQLKTLESHVLVIIEDSGTGISEDDLSKIFQEFYRVDDTAASASGTGLGLSIVARLCKQLEIPVDVNSVVEEGSQFELKIKKSELPDDKQSAIDSSLSPISKTKLALVTDNPGAYHHVVALLKRWGAEVFTVSDMPDSDVDLLVVGEDAQPRLPPHLQIAAINITPDISPMKLRRLVQQQRFNR